MIMPQISCRCVGDASEGNGVGHELRAANEQFIPPGYLWQNDLSKTVLSCGITFQDLIPNSDLVKFFLNPVKFNEKFMVFRGM
jgi:hypothetical protein